MAITMKEIAGKLGVSTSTVSRALSNDSAISREVRRSVQELARRYSFRKQRVTSKTIAYVIDDRYFHVTSRFYNEVIAGIQEALRSENYRFELVLVSEQDADKTSDRIHDFAGMIITSSFHHEFALDLEAYGLPAVLLDYYIPTDYTPSVVVDNTDGTLIAMNYLVGLGHTRFLYLQGDLSDIGAADRLVGFKRALSIHSIDADACDVVSSGLRMNDAYLATLEFFRSNRGSSPTAVVGVNDMVALGALQAVREIGLRVPADVSIVGFDGIDMIDEIVPRLTTMHVDKRLLGRLAVQELLHQIKVGTKPYHKVAVKPTLRVGDSSGPPPQGPGSPTVTG